MITGLPTKSISAISSYHSGKHLSEFYPQDGGESQLALELRRCNPMYTADSDWTERTGVRAQNHCKLFSPNGIKDFL